MINKVIMFIVSLTFVFVISAPAKSYDDAEPIIKELVLSLETFIKVLEKADTAPEIAVALKGYSKSMNEVAPKFAKIIKKYPELGDEKTHPESLKPLIVKMEDMSKKLIKLFSKINAHMSDPGVKAAFEEMNKASAKMDPKEEAEEK